MWVSQMVLETLGRRDNSQAMSPAHPRPLSSFWSDLFCANRAWSTFLLKCTSIPCNRIDFFFSGCSRLDDWLLDRMASCQHLLFPASSERSRQLVESSWQPATALEDRGESLEWSLMFPMEVCDSKYALIIMISSVSCYRNLTMVPWCETNRVQRK